MCFFSAFVSSVLSSIWVLVSEASNRAAAFVLRFVVFLPRVFFFLPLSLAVRWILSVFTFNHSSLPSLRKFAPLIISLIFFMLAGFFSLKDKETRLSLAAMNELIKAGMQASVPEELPKPLRSVEGFIQNAKGEYYFVIGSNPDMLPVQRQIVEVGVIEPFIITQFENGFRFGCVFSPPYTVPVCGNF